MRYPGFNEEWALKRGVRLNRNATQPRTGSEVPQPTRKAAAPKYGNVRTEVDGIKFDSKLEAKRFVENKLRVRSGDLLWFIRQVPFDLPGGLRYWADFVEVSPGGVAVVDCKGMLTQVFKMKAKLFRERYGFEIEIVK